MGAPDHLLAVAERLCGEEVVAATICGGGANNQVYRIQTVAGVFAMKSYGSVELDDRDRLGHEFDGVRFLKSFGIGKALPNALAVDRDERCALYEWIEGKPALDHDRADIVAVLELMAAMHAARLAVGAESMPEATEAVLRPADLESQIARRLERLATVSPGEPELAAFLTDELRPELGRRVARYRLRMFETLPAARRTLSPSDFGFHNALRRPDGTLCFLDFEYFGWDDPAKLVSDFLLHPGMTLSKVAQESFMEGAAALYGADEDFLPRLAASFPLYGIRWVLIMLNEFLPQLWKRRAFSGKGRDWEGAKRAQLHKARAKLDVLRSYLEGHPAT